jgi:hypothetical protein
VAALLSLAATAWAQDDVEKLRRDHERQMRELEQRQKAERERLDREFRAKAEKLEAPNADLQKRCDELLAQVEKLLVEVRKLQSQLGGARSGARAVLERVIEQKGGKPRILELEKLKEIVPFRKKGGGDDEQLFEYEIPAEKLEQFRKRVLEGDDVLEFEIVPGEKGGKEYRIVPKGKKKFVEEEDERREY